MIHLEGEGGGVSFRGCLVWGALPPPPLGCAENFIYKSFNDTINGNLCLCEKVPDSTKLHLIKGPKSKFPGDSAQSRLGAEVVEEGAKANQIIIWLLYLCIKPETSEM